MTAAIGLRLPLVAAAAAMSVALAPVRRAGAQPDTSAAARSLPPTVSTSGHGETTVTPDRATVRLGVETRAPSVSAAADESARRQRRVLDALHAAGIPAEQIRTAAYDVSTERVYGQGDAPPKVTGYRVSNVVEVEIRRIDRVGPILDAALGAGANTIHSVTFHASEVAVAQRDAVARAVEDARRAAEAMASAAGGTLGPLLELTGGPSAVLPPRPMMVGRAAMVPAAPTPIEAGEQTVTATVTARWQFVPARR